MFVVEKEADKIRFAPGQFSFVEELVRPEQFQNLAPSAKETVMSKQDNIKAQEQFGKAVNSGKLDAIKEVMAAGVVDHDPAPDQGPGPDGFIHFFETMRAAFPDLNVTVDQMVADDDNVAIAYTITGTHQGEFMNVPATNRRIKARGVQIARFEDGKIIERWGSSDQLGILQQIGARNVAA